jgi:hypothetical protein
MKFAILLLAFTALFIALPVFSQISPLQEKAIAKHKHDAAAECAKQKLTMKSPADAGKAKTETFAKCMAEAGHPGPVRAK